MTANPFDPMRCPLCGQPNQCANEVARATGIGQGPCWCTRVDFSEELLQKVPDAAKRKACICHNCALNLPDTPQ